MRIPYELSKRELLSLRAEIIEIRAEKEAEDENLDEYLKEIEKLLENEFSGFNNAFRIINKND